MTGYKEIIVFEGYQTLYTNEGFMHDSERTNMVTKAKLLYRDEDELRDGTLCYLKSCEIGQLPIWSTEKESEIDGRSCLSVCSLNTGTIYPLPEEFTVNLEPARREGEFCCFINSKPEVNGLNCSRKKIFFPDRNWTGKIHSGPAVVSISREMDTYGFVTGHMISMDRPIDKEKFCCWCCDKGIDFIKCRFIFELESETRGHLWVMDEQHSYDLPHVWETKFTNSYSLICEKQMENDEVDYQFKYHDIMEQEAKTARIIDNVSLADFICKTLYGCNTPHDIFRKFRQPDIFRLHRTLSEPWDRREETFMALIQDRLDQAEYGGDIEDALGLMIYKGLIAPRTLLNKIPMLEITEDYSKMINILSLIPEEIDDMVSFINTLNKDGDEAIKSLVQHGRMTFVKGKRGW